MWAIRSTMDNEEVWFQGLIPRERSFDVAWSTTRAAAATFGEKRAAEDTALLVGTGTVEPLFVFAPSVAFALDATERSKSDAWITEHNKAHAGQGHTAIGGRYTYSFTPTTLGTVASVACSCGESVDLTNYEEW